MSRSSKWFSNFLLHQATMYKENKQEYNSSARAHFLWTRYFTSSSVARSPWLPSREWHSHFSGGNGSSAGSMVFILPSDLFLVRLHHPQAPVFSRSQPGKPRGTHIWYLYRQRLPPRPQLAFCLAVHPALHLYCALNQMALRP